MRKLSLLLVGTALALALGVQANAEVVNEKALQKGFNPQPDPPIVNPGGQSTTASKLKNPGGAKGIVVINNKPGTKGAVKMGTPPDDSKVKGVFATGNKPGSKAATKMGVSPEPFRPGSGVAAKGLVPSVQAPAGKR